MGYFPPIPQLADEYWESKLHDQERVIGIYSPSDLAKCKRLMYCLYTGLVKTEAKVEDVHGLFEAGKKFEAFIGEVLDFYLKKHPDLELANSTQRNVTQIVDHTIVPPIQLNGKADYMTMLRDRRDRTKSLLLEIKSIYSIRKLTEPILDHKVQIMPYILALRPLEARIVYGERNNYRMMKEFEVTYDSDIQTWLLERAKDIDGYLRRGEMPPPEARICVKCKSSLLERSKNSTKDVFCPSCKSEYPEDESNLWRADYCPAGDLCCKKVKTWEPKK
jgi:hypothetical protein